MITLTNKQRLFTNPIKIKANSSEWVTEAFVQKCCYIHKYIEKDPILLSLSRKEELYKFYTNQEKKSHSANVMSFISTVMFTSTV